MPTRLLLAALAAGTMTIGLSSTALAAPARPQTGEPNCHGHFIAFNKYTTGVNIEQASTDPAFARFTGGTVKGGQEFARDYCGR